MPNTNTFKGRMTLPAEKGMDKELALLMEKWGCDAVRDSDGTELPANIKELGMDVYSTLCMVRADKEFGQNNRDVLQQKYLMSDPVTAFEDSLTIELLKGYYDQQFEIDCAHQPAKWWEVRNRSTGEVLKSSEWDFDAKKGAVTIAKAQKYNVYTVAFLVYQVWDSTSMYNALTNGWSGDHPGAVDPFQPKAREHLKVFLQKWLGEHPATDIVRFTSVAYHFTNIFSDKAEPRYRDWSGYTDMISPYMIEKFEKERGYRLSPEDFVTAGYLNSCDRVPSKQYLDWIDFVNEHLVAFCKEWVDITHQANRKAMLFFCDHWIGTEPYGKRFDQIGFDSLVNPVKNAIELRRIADVPGNYQREARLYPYFFPVNLGNQPSFAPGGNPKAECVEFWMLVRRALMQKLIERIGFGGYTNLAVQFPDFIDYVAILADEFREMHAMSQGVPSYKAPFKVGVLNAWGKSRSWITKEFHLGGLMESLGGLPFEVEFFNFEDIEASGIPAGVKVIINTGNADTAWSGGQHWTRAKVTSAIREFVAKGGGFIGVGEPSAHDHEGKFFQISDVLGVDKERHMSVGRVKTKLPSEASHFITADGGFDLGFTSIEIFADFPEQLKVLVAARDGIKIATNNYQKGRSVYLAGYNFSWANVRLLYRSILWAAGQEELSKKWFSSNYHTEVSAFEKGGRFAVYNNTNDAQETEVFRADGKTVKVSLAGNECKWFDI